MRAVCLLIAGLGLVAPLAARAAPGDAKPPAPPPGAPAPDPKEADRHFKSGVALFKDKKYAEALAEFERAYEIAPHPLVLYNIAGCHRELSHFTEAATFYLRFLTDGKGKVAAARLSAAQAELDAILPQVVRVTVNISPAVDGTVLLVDGTPRDRLAAPLILPPGEHQLIARAAGRRDGERTVQLTAGDSVTVDLTLDEVPATPATTAPRSPAVETDANGSPAPAVMPMGRFAVGAGFGTNLRLPGETGAPSLSFAAPIGSRFEIGLDAVLVAYAIIPSVRVRVAGDALALHVIGAVPYSLSDGGMSDRFAAVALGLGLRYRAIPGVTVRLETYAAFAGAAHGMSIPVFLGGERWF